MTDKIKNYLRCRKGLSLVEVLVTVLIFAVLMAAINTVLLVGESTWQVNSVQAELQQELRKAMEWMKDELRQTGGAGISGGPITADDTTWHDSITFQKVTGITAGGRVEWGGGDPDATTQFVLGGADGNQIQKIVRDDDGNVASTTVLANNIKDMRFRRQDRDTPEGSDDIIEVELDAEKDTTKGTTITANLSFEVLLRN